MSQPISLTDMKDKINEIIEVSIKKSVIEKSGVDGCDRCNKKGLVFLPVRYAVGTVEDLENYSLPSNKVNSYRAR